MTTISPLSVGAPAGFRAVWEPGSAPRDAEKVGARTGGFRTTTPLGVNGTGALVDLGNRIGQLLQGIGGDVQDSRMLQLLIGLLILLALLEGSSKNGESAADTLSGMGNAVGGRGTYAMFSASTTSITVEHTSVTMTASAVETMAAPAGYTPSQGQEIDLAA